MLGEEDSALGEEALRRQFRARLARILIERSHAVMATARRFAPESGVLAEQFSHIDGAPTSALNLTWSYASFIIAFACRGQALRATSA
ncbi:glycoside hydrolase family 15 protein [Rhodoblastus acidophilus]|uniref:Glycoside hydrolase family 15 protein n=1 Tax=Candidatus Rhodoblastus alkanivorans TaxID=2954117 RepID=A0ABS9Z6C3_9HYPH|nr:glycoside hydrolase family 15 protein [Candidatus Rhodoblastus alkanivorans]MCI4679175.1 glycoside hydrolase family 15 protein [Candidatus Rhodoblastus alkanivorans]MCI4683171.1 glycoside hydrolase family 15 protein [Candidatus Rhodoblastus alkanivorans]MDI4640482.1 glycoside hydrolase family 15 protein [Rhodoblastus acidophilus]